MNIPKPRSRNQSRRAGLLSKPSASSGRSVEGGAAWAERSQRRRREQGTGQEGAKARAAAEGLMRGRLRQTTPRWVLSARTASTLSPRQPDHGPQVLGRGVERRKQVHRVAQRPQQRAPPQRLGVDPVAGAGARIERRAAGRAGPPRRPAPPSAGWPGKAAAWASARISCESSVALRAAPARGCPPRRRRRGRRGRPPRQRVAGVGVRVQEGPALEVVGVEQVVDGVGGQHRRQRQEAGGQPLGQHDEVGQAPRRGRPAGGQVGGQRRRPPGPCPAAISSAMR